MSIIFADDDCTRTGFQCPDSGWGMSASFDPFDSELSIQMDDYQAEHKPGAESEALTHDWLRRIGALYGGLFNATVGYVIVRPVATAAEATAILKRAGVSALDCA